jgi:hypothetical protein
MDTWIDALSLMREDLSEEVHKVMGKKMFQGLKSMLTRI